jgi:hypothetical protein
MKILKLFPVFIVYSMFLISCNDESPVAVDPLYDNNVPKIKSCEEGSLSETEKLKVSTYINSIRTTHNLPVVMYYEGTDKEVQQQIVQEAALIVAANASISENIAESDTECYPKLYNNNDDKHRKAVVSAYRNGNRSLWGSESSKWPSSEVHINDWLTELNSGNINNRRRLLDPFLKSVIFGRVIGTPKKGEFKYVSSAVLLTTGDNENLSEFEGEYIAYPKGNYSAKLFDSISFLSFSIIYDKSSKLNNGASFIDFSEATVEVSAGTQKLEIDSLTFDYNNIGLPNNLQWKVQGLTKNVSYTVKISNVRVGEEYPKNYDYTFSFK